MKTLREQLESKCVHFNGVQYKTCRAHVAYADFKSLRDIPCFKEALDIPCKHRNFPSEEEVTRQVNNYNFARQKMELALKLVEPIRKDYKDKGYQGVLECPVCKNKLHVSMARCNNHVHAKCETPNCIMWME